MRMREIYIPRNWWYLLGCGFFTLPAVYGTWAITWPAVQAARARQPLPAGSSWWSTIFTDLLSPLYS